MYDFVREWRKIITVISTLAVLGGVAGAVLLVEARVRELAGYEIKLKAVPKDDLRELKEKINDIKGNQIRTEAKLDLLLDHNGLTLE